MGNVITVKCENHNLYMTTAGYLVKYTSNNQSMDEQTYIQIILNRYTYNVILEHLVHLHAFI